MKAVRSGVVVIGALLATMGTAHAYLDPGTISTLLHSVLASLVALGIALKLYWHRLLRFLGLRKKAPEAESTASGSSNAKEPDNQGN